MTTPPSPPKDNFRHGIWLFAGGFLLFLIISYTCKRMHGIVTAINRHSAAIRTAGETIKDNNRIDETDVSSYPRFTYSELNADKKKINSSCSICLGDYKDNDCVRVLPNCEHLFHLKCIDPWIIKHPTCPVCRKSPGSTTVQIDPIPEESQKMQYLATHKFVGGKSSTGML